MSLPNSGDFQERLFFFHLYTICSCWSHQQESVRKSFGVSSKVPSPFLSLPGHPVLSFHPFLSQNNQEQKKKIEQQTAKTHFLLIRFFPVTCLPSLLDHHGKVGLREVVTSGLDISVWVGNGSWCFLWCCRDAHTWSLSQEVRCDVQ